jgi:hypothetical protein
VVARFYWTFGGGPVVHRSKIGGHVSDSKQNHGRGAASHTGSSRSERPTIFAARCKVAIVTLPSFGSSRRLIWLRLVPMRSARRLRDKFCAFMASAICHASTSLMATASASELTMHLQDRAPPLPVPLPSPVLRRKTQRFVPQAEQKSFTNVPRHRARRPALGAAVAAAATNTNEHMVLTAPHRPSNFAQSSPHLHSAIDHDINSGHVRTVI